MRPAVPVRTSPPYPNTQEAINYAEQYRLEVFVKTGDPKGYAIYQHNPHIDVKPCGGLNNYFIVYAYPPAGFWYDDLTSVTLITPFRAWILRYHPQAHSYAVLSDTHNHGFAHFENLKLAIGL